MKVINWKYNIGDNIKDEKRNLIIINREIREKDQWYKYRCLKCGNENWISKRNLYKRGCNACGKSPKKIILGINTIWDKARWMCDLGVSEEDAKSNFVSSNKVIIVKCPKCGKIIKKKISNIYKAHSIACICSDGISYPEKFMYSILKQLNIKFEFHKTFEWSNNKEYDFYLKDYNIIIEVNGGQHYKETNRGRSLQEEIQNDKSKHDIAFSNGIKKYIVIDARYSTCDFIKENIFKSELNKLFNLDNINWGECEKYALKNLIKSVCDYWNNNPNIVAREIGELFGYNENTIRCWLKKGVKLGWCNYNPKNEMKKNGRNNGGCNAKKVLCIETGITYPSITEAEKQTGCCNIIACCKGKRENTKGLHWKYID